MQLGPMTQRIRKPRQRLTLDEKFELVDSVRSGRPSGGMVRVTTFLII